MKTTQGNLSTLVLFLFITGLVFLFFIGSVFAIWFVLFLLRTTSDFWSMIEALATALAAAGVFGGAFVAYRELSEISSSRHLEVANQLFSDLNSDENVEARRWIFQNLPDDPLSAISSLSIEGRNSIKRVLNSLDHVAFITQSGWIPEDLVMPWMHPMIIKSWKKLEPYVIYERQRRNEPYYYIYASELAKRCERWRKRNIKDEEYHWVKDAL